MRLHPPIVHPGRAPALVAALALAVGLAACGASPSTGGVVSLTGPSASPGASAAPSASVDPEEAMLAFTRCMKEHGVDVQVATAVGDGGSGTIQVGGDTKGEDPQAAAAPIDPKAAQAADEACRHLLPAGGMGDPNATMDPALADQLLKFAQCMRDHGVDYPDPQFSGNGVSIQVGGGENGAGNTDPTSETFKTAQATCAKDLPGGGPFVIGGSGSSSGSGTGPVTGPVTGPGTVVSP